MCIIVTFFNIRNKIISIDIYRHSFALCILKSICIMYLLIENGKFTQFNIGVIYLYRQKLDF